MSTPRQIALVGVVLAMAGVALGAFGAHGLRPRLTAPDLATFETGVRYQVYHALGLLAVAWIADRWPGGLVTVAARLILLGTLVFSVSLYFLVITGPRWLGAVTPLGGVSLIVGWAALAVHLWRSGERA
jgi:uncharacterized membrane protein YgdD (TMEM256/DUF423 family)